MQWSQKSQVKRGLASIISVRKRSLILQAPIQLN